MLTVDNCWAYLEEVADPEVPVLSIVDLGIVRAVEVDSAKENLQYQSERVEELKTQLQDAERERSAAADSLRQAADNAAEEYQSA